MMLINTLVLVLCFLFEQGKCNVTNDSLKLVIDNDAGGDDAMAIFLALLYEKHFDGPPLIGLTTCHGNTLEDNVYVNNQKILRTAKRQDIPIYRGAKSSLVLTNPFTNYYGNDGLGDNNEEIQDLVPAKEESAVTKLIELSKIHTGKLVVIVIGPLTNIALAVKLDPAFIARLNHLYVGAGHIHDDIHPNPEFNAMSDVEAYHVVAQNSVPDKVTVLPFSQARHQLNFSRDWRETVLGGVDSKIIKAQNIYERVSLKRTDRWQALDPAVVAMVVKPDLVKDYKYSKNDIIVCGENRGLCTNALVEEKDANVRVIHEMKTEEYKKFLLDVFTADTNKL